ncbi:hypothetical protein [Streptomyces sudanensis]|uniref:hypothetical protein n=1 Tax=Streptomyces sudanensis TaxID=436397 RepID=UPI0020CC8CB6|nr:hypothetical protein [Streptomyces sudanensis]MCP9957286.1 hypothetical protein [Streptomyces sudanensis]MCQ0002155.1 hypothetical protein [Streptomyces sudanensis]
MSGATGPTAHVYERKSSRTPNRFGTAVCTVILALGHMVTGYVILTAYMVEPDGPWDRQAVTHAGLASGIGLALSAVAALLSWVFVKAAWLRRWWYVLPVVLAFAALLRLTVLSPEL